MRTATRERLIGIMAVAGVVAIMFFSWLDSGLYADKGNCGNGGLRCRFFAI
jgi:hypothetical protein